MLKQFCKNGHPGGKLTWITLQRMAQLVWYIWCKEAKKISQFAPRTNLSTVVGDAEKEGERKKKKIQRHDSTELLCCCREVSSARHGTRSMMGVVIGMFISRVWDWSRLIYHGGVLKIMLLLPKSLVELLVIMGKASKGLKCLGCFYTGAKCRRAIDKSGTPVTLKHKCLKCKEQTWPKMATVFSYHLQD